MQTLFLLVVLFSLSVWGQFERISDPGFFSLAENQCSSDSVWQFRSDYLWNETSDFVDAQCQAFLELPTDARSGLTKGNETNVNKFTIPALPTVSGGDSGFPASAAVVDFNAPCRASLWAPFDVHNNSATIDLSFLIWTTPVSNVQSFIDNSQVPNATLLQYLMDPFGLLQQDTNVFPPVEDVVNQIRVDILKPDASGSFYDEAFSLLPDQIAASFEIPFFDTDNAIPESGTSHSWVPVSFTTTLNSGTYALRFASAHSVIGSAWGVANVHVLESGGTIPDNTTVTTYEWDMVIDNAAQTVGGTLTVSKTVLIARKQEY